MQVGKRHWAHMAVNATVDLATNNIYNLVIGGDVLPRTRHILKIYCLLII